MTATTPTPNRAHRASRPADPDAIVPAATEPAATDATATDAAAAPSARPATAGADTATSDAAADHSLTRCRNGPPLAPLGVGRRALFVHFLPPGPVVPLSINSPAFEPFGAIPPQYTCDGDGRSPPLSWSGVPEGTRSLALVVEDPDAPDPAAPKRVFVHWVLYNLPANSDGVPDGVRKGNLPRGTREGRNDWDRPAYGGPCPPVGRHRYFFRLVALDTELAELRTPSKAELEAAMANHVIEMAELVGTYERSR